MTFTDLVSFGLFQNILSKASVFRVSTAKRYNHVSVVKEECKHLYFCQSLFAIRFTGQISQLISHLVLCQLNFIYSMSLLILKFSFAVQLTGRQANVSSDLLVTPFLNIVENNQNTLGNGPNCNYVDLLEVSQKKDLKEAFSLQISNKAQ